LRTVAVCSDVHADVDSFRAVLAEMRERDVDEVWCLGDLVGNGMHPVGCVELARERCSVVLAGNHDPRAS
jgi:protein phosphatase